MIVDVTQRWRAGRARYRPAREPIDVARHEVAAIADDTAKRFVIEHHYSGTYPAARFRFGLYRGELLVGVAVFSVPANPRALDVLPGGAESGVELGRFVLLDDVPANGETWFLGRAFEALRGMGIAGVVSFSDPQPRATSAGGVVFPGHIGTIYQAHNASYLGTSKAERRRLLPDGTMLHNRALTKIRREERGWRYAMAQLVEHGAAPLRDEAPRAWLDRELARITRTVAHPGNHKYAWALHRRDRRHLPTSRPYPKVVPSDPRSGGDDR